MSFFPKTMSDLEFKDKGRIRVERGNKCQVCGSHGPILDHHHAIFRSETGSTNEEWNDILICRKCHQKEKSPKMNKLCKKIAEFQKKTGGWFDPIKHYKLI